jgi:hypothetical protein
VSSSNTKNWRKYVSEIQSKNTIHSEQSADISAETEALAFSTLGGIGLRGLLDGKNAFEKILRKGLDNANRQAGVTSHAGLHALLYTRR